MTVTLKWKCCGIAFNSVNDLALHGIDAHGVSHSTSDETPHGEDVKNKKTLLEEDIEYAEALVEKCPHQSCDSCIHLLRFVRRTRVAVKALNEAKEVICGEYCTSDKHNDYCKEVSHALSVIIHGTVDCWEKP